MIFFNVPFAVLVSLQLCHNNSINKVSSIFVEEMGIEFEGGGHVYEEKN